jgi:hypothetical protein
MLTNIQLEDLAQRMKVPLEFVGFKNELPKKLKTNRAYIINSQDDEDDETGELNSGAHWACMQIMEYPNGKIEGIYFDSYGSPPPEIVNERVMNNFKIKKIPYNTKDIQSMMNSACGWYCLAFLHFINVFPQRSKNLYWDVEAFLSLFEDLNKSIDFKKNEYILKMFFQPEDPKLRKPIEVISDPDRITDGCEQKIDSRNLPVGATFDKMETIAVDIKYV